MTHIQQIFLKFVDCLNLTLYSVSHSVVFDSLLPHGLQPHQAPLSMEFSRQEYWSGLQFHKRVFFFQYFIMKIYKHRNITRAIYETDLQNNYVQQYLNNLPPFLYYILVFLLKHFKICCEQHSTSHLHDLAEIS